MENTKYFYFLFVLSFFRAHAAQAPALRVRDREVLPSDFIHMSANNSTN
jgi:hypothetical protein